MSQAMQAGPQPSGIRGWLLLFVIGQIALVIYAVAVLPSVVGSTIRQWPRGHNISMLRPVLTLGLFGSLFTTVLPLIGLGLIQTRSPDAPRYWSTCLAFMALYAAAAFILNVVLSNQLVNVVGPAGAHDAAKSLDERNGGYIRMVVGTLIWASYWRRSLRVRNTFGATPAGTA